MTKREKTDIKEKTQAALRVVSSLYCSGEPFWSTTTITREQLDAIREGLNVSKTVVAKDALVCELTARVNALNDENTKLRAALARLGGTPADGLLDAEPSFA